MCPHLNVTSFYRETQVWDSISRVTTTMLQKEFYFWTLGILTDFSIPTMNHVQKHDVPRQEESWLSPTTAWKEQEIFPGSSLYHIRIRRAVRRHSNKKVWKDTLTAQMAPLPHQILKSATHLKNDEQGKEHKNNEQEAAGVQCQEVIFIGKIRL